MLLLNYQFLQSLLYWLQWQLLFLLSQEHCKFNDLNIYADGSHKRLFVNVARRVDDGTQFLRAHGPSLEVRKTDKFSLHIRPSLQYFDKLYDRLIAYLIFEIHFNTRCYYLKIYLEDFLKYWPFWKSPAGHVVAPLSSYNK